MPSVTFAVFSLPDNAAVEAQRQIWQRLGSPPNGQITFSFADSGSGHQSVSAPVAEVESNPTLQPLLELGTSVARSLQLGMRLTERSLPANVGLTRAKPNTNPPQLQDSVYASIDDQADPQLTAAFFAAVHGALAQYEAPAAMQQALGPALGTFYQHREESLLRLEELTTRLIRQNAEYRDQVDLEVARTKERLQEEQRQRRQELEADYQRKDQALADRETELAERLKILDDREFTHVRRKLREELKKRLDDWATQFALTRETAEKRRPIHFAFIASLLVLVGSAVWAFIDLRAAQDTQHFLYDALRGALSLVGFFGMMVYYIRWNDQWAQAHADEEFRLKRMAIGVDRASWVVEMAFEWKEEKGTQIPRELLDRLTEHLFATDDRERSARHPAQDLTSALLRASASAKIPLPFGGEVTVDRKGMRELEEKVVGNGNG